MARASSRSKQNHTDDGAIVPAGDAAVVVRVGRTIGPRTHQRVMRLLAQLEAAHLPGVLDLVPAYASLLVHFDPLLTGASTIAAALGAGSMAQVARLRPHLVRVPVRYGGEAGPDLAAIAQQLGISADEVVRLHTTTIQRVYFIGFLAGFPYLGELPPALAVPRLAIPRPRVPAGSVAIAQRQTGIYPVASPGGWQLIGQTTVALFDPQHDPPALLRPGDRVRFVPVADPAAAPTIGASHAASSLTNSATTSIPSTPAALPTAPADTAPDNTGDAVPWLRVLRPGALTTVQDMGRRGYARYGVALAGAADRDALALGNLLLGNPADAAALEVTYGAVEFAALAACTISVTGADAPVLLDGVARPMNTALSVMAGTAIALGAARVGVRSYLCVGGGIAVAPVLGSRSTDLRAAFGGLAGRALCAGDMVARRPPVPTPPGRVGAPLPPDPVRAPLPTGSPIALRILPGPHASKFPADLALLLAETFEVRVHADRGGVRLRPRLQSRGANSDAAGHSRVVGGEVLSEGVPHGALQLPAGGEPILLLADHQTTGGYHVPAVVITADHWRIAQLRPGDTLTFTQVSSAHALEALRARQRWHSRVAEQLTRGASGGADAGIPDPAILMRGFAEGGEEPEASEALASDKEHGDDA